MPVIPIRERTVSDGVPGLARQGSANTQVVDTSNQLLKNASGILNQIQTERNEAKSQEAYNTFSAMNLQTVSGISQNFKGADAVDSVPKYEEWYQEQTAKTLESLENGPQKKAFQDMAERAKRGSVNSLTTHQATQARAYQKTVFEGDMATINAEVGVYPSLVDEYIKEAGAKIDKQFAGLDSRAAKLSNTAGLATTAALAYAETGDMEGAFKVIEDYKKPLGSKTYNTLKSKFTVKDVNQKALAETNLVATTHPDDLKAQLAFARETIFDADILAKTESNLKTRDTEAKKFKKEANAAHISSLTNETLDMIKGQASQTVVEDEILPQIEDGGDRLKMKKMIAAQFKAEGRETDQTVLDSAMEAIDNAIEKGIPLTDEQIRLDYDYGLSGAASRQVRAYNKRAINNNAKMGVSSVKTQIAASYDSGLFGEVGSDAAKIRKGEAKDDLQKWVDENPKRDPGEWWKSRKEVSIAETTAESYKTFDALLNDPNEFNPFAEGTRERIVRVLDEDNVSLATYFGMNEDNVEQFINTLEDEEIDIVLNSEKFLKIKAARLKDEN